MSASVAALAAPAGTPAPNLAVALHWAAKGIPVFPCGPDKKPRVSGGYKAGTLDQQIIRGWWERWPNSLPGLALPSVGLFAIDADRHGKADGVLAWDLLAVEHGLDLAAYPATLTPGNGRHIYFRCPPGFEPTNGTGSLPPGIDVRGAGHAIAPGTELADGRRYEPDPDTPPLSLDIPEAPAWLVGMIRCSRRRVADNQTPVVELDSAAAIERASAYLRDEAPEAVEGQGGDQTTFRVAAKLKDFGLSAACTLELMTELWNERCSPPWDLEELRRKVENAFAYGRNAPGVSSGEALTAGVSIVPPCRVARLSESPRLRWGDEPSSYEPVRWLLKGVLPRVGLALVYGAPKSGKSFAIFDLAARLTCGQPWLGVRAPKEQTGALLLLGEGERTVDARLKAFQRATGVSTPPAVASAGARGLTDPAALAEAKEIVRQAVAGMEARGLRLGLIVVDTIASAMGLEDENAAPEVTAALHLLEDLAQEFGACVVAIHHSGKAGRGPRGSSAFTASADVVLEVTRDTEQGGVKGSRRQIAITESKVGPEDWSAAFELASVTLEMDEDGDPVTSCVVTQADPGARGSLGAQRQAQFVECLRAASAAAGEPCRDGVEIAEVRKRCYALWGDVKDDARRQAFLSAEKELQSVGRIQVQPGRGERRRVLLVPEHPVSRPASLFGA